VNDVAIDAAKTSEQLLELRNVTVRFDARGRGASFTAVDDVSLALHPGEVLGLVGESGSGKSTIGNVILGLVRPDEGTLNYGTRDITDMSIRERHRSGINIQAIFQDPYSSLNPALRIGDILTEPVRLRTGVSRREASELIRALLERVNLPADAASRYPSSFSGGQRQRIAIARALSVEPSVLVCDEPTSALDVSTQSRIIELLSELRDELGVALLFITHDLALTRSFASRVLVLEHGRVVEEGTAEQICDAPTNPYTKLLIASVPVPDPELQRERRLQRGALARQAAEFGP
jgi:ABC-type glutathione transport system ATPase component